MLYFQRDRFIEFSREGDPVHSTHQLRVVWKVVVATEARLDGDGDWRKVRLQGICWHLQPQTMALPLISFPCSQCHCGSGHNVSSSDGGWTGGQEFTLSHTLTTPDIAVTMSIKTQITVTTPTSTYHTSFQGCCVCLQPPSSPSPNLLSLTSFHSLILSDLPSLPPLRMQGDGEGVLLVITDECTSHSLYIVSVKTQIAVTTHSHTTHLFRAVFNLPAPLLHICLPFLP